MPASTTCRRSIGAFGASWAQALALIADTAEWRTEVSAASHDYIACPRAAAAACASASHAAGAHARAAASAAGRLVPVAGDEAAGADAVGLGGGEPHQAKSNHRRG